MPFMFRVLKLSVLSFPFLLMSYGSSKQGQRSILMENQAEEIKEVCQGCLLGIGLLPVHCFSL